MAYRPDGGTVLPAGWGLWESLSQGQRWGALAPPATPLSALSLVGTGFSPRCSLSLLVVHSGSGMRIPPFKSQLYPVLAV